MEEIRIKKTIVFKSDKGVCFERTDYKKRSRVAVRNGDFFIQEYRFNNTHEINFDSPYVSWENLNCCNGWHYNEQYLMSAVQENKKICAGIQFKSAEEMSTYIDGIDIEKYDYIDRSWDNGPYRFHLLDLVRKGSLSDYYKKEDIIKFYELLGLSWEYVDLDRFNELFNADLFDLINGSKNYEYGSIHKTLAEYIITGLLLGYPLESTVGIIFQ